MLYSGEALEEKAPGAFFVDCMLVLATLLLHVCILRCLSKDRRERLSLPPDILSFLEKKTFLTRTLSNIFSARKIEECLAGKSAKEHLQPLDAISYDSSTVAPRSPCFLQPSS